MKLRLQFIGLAVLLSARSAPADGTNAAPLRPSPPDPALFLQGRYVFQQNCVVCHGRYGDGKGELSPTLDPRPRNFSLGVFKFRSTPSGSLPTNEDLARVIRNGLGGTAMPTFTQLSERDVRAVVEYLKSFSSRWKDPRNLQPALPLPARPEWFKDETTRASAASRGRLTFVALCSACHGTEGDGRGPAAATLQDAWGQPARPRDLRSAPLRNGPEPEDLYRTLVTGLDGTPMPAFLETTTVDQRWELVAFLLELRQRRATAR